VSTPDDAGPWAPARRGLTIGLLLSVTTHALAALAVVTIAPRIPAELGGLELYGWLFSGYLLTSLLGTVWGGGEADRRGLRPPFAIGLAVFGLGLGLAAVAPSMLWVVGARALQGFGGGAVTTLVYVAVTRSYPDRHRSRLMAYLSTAWVTPALIGPALAGALAEAAGWRAVFVALAAVLTLVALLTLPRLGSTAASADAEASTGGDASTGADAPVGGARSGVGLLPALGVVAGLGGVLAALSWWTDRGVGAAAAASASIVAGLAAAATGLRRLLPAGTLRLSPGLGTLVVARAGFFAGFIGVEAFLALMLTDLQGLSSAATGAVIATGAISWTAGSWWQARRDASDEGRRARGRRVVIGVGFLGVGLALQGVALAGVGDGAAWVPAVAVLGWMTAGFGIGTAHATSSVFAFALAESGGVAAGRVSVALQLADNVGAAFVTGLAGAALAFVTAAQGGAADAGGAGGATSQAGVAAAFAVAWGAWLLSFAAARRNARSTPAAASRS
jgi:MFS family permease